MLAEARVLNTSVMATWKFVDFEQTNINTDRDGTYNFKGIYCSLVGKGVARLFTAMTDDEYTMRYVRFDPRNVNDNPNEFEEEALHSFYDDGAEEHYDIVTSEDGGREFRYVAAIHLEKSCLECHGEPAGELDITGNPKEGLVEGAIGGAVSITMPLDLHESSIRANLLNSALLMILFLTIVFAATSVFFRRQVVKPLSDLDNAAKEIGNGELNTHVSLQGAREVSDLAKSIIIMERELDAMYSTLEEKVDLRTKQYLEANALLDCQKEKIAEQNALLKQANEKLQEENEYRSSIVSILGHELRTPLTAILAFVDLWQASDEFHNERSKEYCLKIKNHSLTLLEMVNNVLDIARLDAGMNQINKEVIDLVDLIGDIAAIEEPLAQQKGVSFSTCIDDNIPLIKEDWQRLRKALMNLVANAVKFTDEGGKVQVKVSFESRGKTMCISVADTGIGIPTDRLDAIFDRFVQVDSPTSRRYGGSGLGLSLVKMTMEAMGGAVSVESTVGKGSVFTLTFPVDIVEEEADEDTDRR